VAGRRATGDANGHTAQQLHLPTFAHLQPLQPCLLGLAAGFLEWVACPDPRGWIDVALTFRGGQWYRKIPCICLQRTTLSRRHRIQTSYRSATPEDTCQAIRQVSNPINLGAPTTKGNQSGVCSICWTATDRSRFRPVFGKGLPSAALVVGQGKLGK
jgi:hypothetical protein